MATRFVRVDLSEEARDYRPIAVEPGVPMLDRSGANARILFRWLGGMAAEPEWDDDLVGFYVRDDQGGRLEDVYCQPASCQDLNGALRDDLAKLRQRLEQSRGETNTERTLRKVLMRSFQDVVDNPARNDHDSYFFKYKDVLGNWRLVWCWGYERLDQESATAVVCTDPNCNLLFVRRPGKSPRCPACAGAIVPKKKKSKRKYAALLLLLLLLLAGLGWWLMQPPKLVAAPDELAGPVGSQREYRITAKGLFRNRDVTHDAGIDVSVSDSRVARVDPAGSLIHLTAAGTTEIEFHYRGGTARLRVSATPAADEVARAQESAHAKQKPDWVKIFSQHEGQDVPSVRFPVGATFTDFKVEVHYPDGYTRFVTKKATLTTAEPPASAPLTADHGTLVGLRPGKTKVSAEFQGIASKEPLDAEVTADVDVDRIAIEPGSAALRPGETYDLHAIGYKNGQSAGDITALGNLNWKSSNPDVARIGGNSVIASNVGEAQVTVERKGLTSAPAQVTVSNTIADDLRVVPGIIEMYEGQRLQLGSDVQVMRGSLDVSQQANVVPDSPGVVDFDPQTRTLTARNTGQVTVGVTLGDKLAHTVVKVGPRPVLAGKLVVEPGSLLLAPGQADRLSVYIETPNGEKIDQTSAATYKVDDSSVAAVDDSIARVRALKPGKTNIAVSVNGMPLSVPLEVTNDEIKELSADPAREEMAVSEVRPLHVFGRADRSGVKEMFPQPDLKAALRKPDVAEVAGDIVRGKAVGEDTIDVTWRNTLPSPSGRGTGGEGNKLALEVPTKVTDNTVTGLQIDPKEFAINTNQGKTYEVTAMRGGRRVILTESDGVQLNVTDPNVADVATGTTVISRAPGQTKVIATLVGEKAEAVLNVTEALPGELIGRDGVIAGGGYFYDGGGHRIFVGGNRIVSEIKPAGKVVALQWEPPLFQKGVQAIPQTAQLHRRYENGGFDDVSNDPKVQITVQPNTAVAKMDKVDGGWKISPVAPGQTATVATLDGMTAQMAIEINGDAAAGPITGTLLVHPSTVTLWSGETAVIASAEVDPGNGLPHIPVKVKITAPENQGIVTASGDSITGRSVGDATVTLTAENGPSATMSVHVTPPDTITVNPPENNMQVGGKVTPAVMAQPAGGGEPVAVQAKIESLDPNVIDADPSSPGQFVAKSQGQTQLHAVYRGKEAFAKVSVAGQRFQSVQSNYNRNDKSVTIDVSAAAGEGELEYRVYEEGAAPKENWVPNQAEGDARKASLRTDPLDTSKDEFRLVIEARDKAGKSVQKYPLTLVRSVTYEQQNAPTPTPEPK